MFNTIESELILYDRKKKINIIAIILSLTFSLMIFISLLLECESFVKPILSVKKLDNTFIISLIVKDSDTKYVLDNNYFDMNSKRVEYDIISIENEYINDVGESYCYIYIKADISKEYLIDNYVTQVKVLKEKKKVISYILDSLN